MGKGIKKIFIYLGLFIAFLLFILVIIAAFFEDKIGQRLITELNKTMKSEMEMEGFDLSLIKGFPNASASLNKVSLPDGFNKNTLFEAEELTFRFNLLSLFSSKVKMKSVLLKNGAVFISYDKKGRANYNVFKETETTTESTENSSSLSLSLEQARLEDVELIYIDELAKQNIKVDVENALLSGEFGAEQFKLKSNAKFLSHFIETAEGKYFVGKNLSYDAEIDIDLATGLYELTNVELRPENNIFSLTGEIQQDLSFTEYDLVVTGEDCTLQSLIEILPKEQKISYLSDIESEGDFNFLATIVGRSSQRESPNVSLEFGLKDGKISTPSLAEPLKDVSFTARLTSGEGTNAKSVFEIQDFKGYMSRELLEAKLLVKDMDNPRITLTMDGAIPMDGIYTIFGDDKITAGNGEVEIKSFKLDGYYNDMVNPNRVNNVETKGTIGFDDAMLKINGEKMYIDRGSMRIENNLIKVSDLKIEGAGSEIEFDGNFKNTLPVLFADSLNSKSASLEFDAALKASNIDFNRLLAITSSEESTSNETRTKEVGKAKNIQERERITNFLKGTFDATVESFVYGKVEGEDFRGKLTFDKNELDIAGRAKAMKGDFVLDGKMFFEEKPKLNAKLMCNKIDGREFFRQSENFGQDYLTHQNIRGTLDAKIAIYSFWDEVGNFLYDKLNVLADITILDGELNDFKMLEDFSTFVKLKDLKSIRFTKTRNWLEIKKETMYLPVMFIQSNAMNLTLNGEYSFNHDLDYRVKVNAGQVVWNKMFKQAGEKPIKAKNGLLNLYYRIFGNIDNFDFKADKKQIKKDFKASEIHKFRIKKALEKEFGRIEQIQEEDEVLDVGEVPSTHESYDTEEVEIIEGY